MITALFIFRYLQKRMTNDNKCAVAGCENGWNDNGPCGHWICRKHYNQPKCQACEQLVANPNTARRADGCPKALIEKSCTFYGCEQCQHYWKDGQAFKCNCYEFGMGKCGRCHGLVPIHEWNFFRNEHL